MRDSEIVATIVAGDPAGLAAAYDCYASVLHAYCRSLLAEPADAADAVQDTFLIASSRLGGLRDPDRLRPWLYAVARNECYRRLRARARTASLDEAGEMTDTSPGDVGTGARRGELRDLVRSAITGLNPGDREVIELNLRHQLDGADLADALGVGVNAAYALQSRARGQLERALGALLVARSGRRSCPQLAALLPDWDGRMTVLLRKRVSRHIEHCAECGERKRRELSPAALLSALPLVVLPPGLRQQVLRLVADVTPDAAQYRATLGRRSGRFRSDGFPVPIAPPPDPRAPVWRGLVAGAVAVAGAALIVSMMLAWPLRHTADASALPRYTGPPSGPASTSATATASASASASASVTATLPAIAPPPGSSSPPSGPAPTPTATRTLKPTPKPTPTPTPTPGVLVATPSTVVLTVIPGTRTYTGTFTLTAMGGPVAKLTITVPATAATGLSVQPASGSLTRGQQVTITVTAIGNGPPGFDTPLTVDPGAVTVSVRYPPRG